MKNYPKLTQDQLHAIAVACYDKLKSATSKGDALHIIAEYALAELGEYFGPGILLDPDNISVHFIELLDHIVFEIEENNSGDNSVRDYIFEDLYNRISIYLQVFKDRDIYAFNLNKRLLTHEDTIIIKHYNMDEYVPLLINEYFEQPALQKSILWTLLAFNDDDLLNFYYQVAKEDGCLEIKIMALMGLKRLDNKFKNWSLLNSETENYGTLISYAESFDCRNISANKFPQDIYSLLFAVYYIELMASSIFSKNTADWIAGIIDSILSLDYDNTYTAILYRSLSNILLHIKLNHLEMIVEDDDHLISFISLIDQLPGEFFSRLIVKLSFLGQDFQKRVNDLIVSDMVELDEIDSNVMNYLFWESESRL